MLVRASDRVTGLPDRRDFREVVEKFSAKAMGSPADLVCGLLLVDLNRFSKMNQAFGDRGADLVLSQVAARVRESVGSAGLVARLSGNEFGVFVTGVPGSEYLKHLAIEIRAAVSQPLSFEGCEFRVDATVGAALEPAGGWRECELVHKADMALRHARSIKSGFHLFTESLSVDHRARIEMTEELRRGLVGGEFYLQYQPQYSALEGNLVGLEGLIRWRRASGRAPGPADFLPLAEEEGLMSRLTGRVIRLAMTQGVAWAGRGELPAIAVNVSEGDLKGGILPRQVSGTAAETGFDCRHLKIEISERTVAADDNRTLRTLHELRELGCRISLDDFGAGVTSLTHLQRLPIDELKLDRSFAQAVVKCPKTRVIVQSTVEMASRLGMSVVAEGVECESGYRILRRLGVSSIQGFHLSRPLEPDDAAKLLPKTGSERPRLRLVSAS